MAKITKTKPPIPLTGEEVTLYRYLKKYLEKNNAWNDVDGLTLARAVRSYSLLDQAESDANKKGWTQEYENGGGNVSPEATLYFKHLKNWEDACKHFGLHVKARDTIKVYKSDTGGQKGILRKLQALHQQAANG